MDSVVVQVSKVSKIYDTSPPVEALKSISFSVNEGEIFGLIGVNGAGKTTLIRILTTMLKPTSGRTRVLGIDPINEPEKVRSLIGVLPQNAGLYEEFTIRENLTFIGKMQGISKDILSQKIVEISKLLGVYDKIDAKVNTLSGGLKQRTMLARTLIGKPKILFLDEPTTGLDVLVARKVRKTIKRLSRDMTIFLATHNMMEAYQLCDRIVVINNGEISLIDTPTSIFNKHRHGSEDFEDVIAKLLKIDEKSLTELDVEI